jgi:hypothetical protein
MNRLLILKMKVAKDIKNENTIQLKMMSTEAETPSITKIL